MTNGLYLLVALITFSALAFLLERVLERLPGLIQEGYE